MPCGPPKPRNAVFDTVFVLQRCEVMRRFGRKYALSQWNTARSLTAPDRSAEMPQLDRDRSVGNGERSGDKMLDLGRVLRRRIQQHLAALPGNGKRDLSLEIEMLLAAAAELPREAQFAAGRTPVAAADLQRRQDDPSLGECLLDRD